MSRARSVADLGNQNVLDLNASAGTLKVGAGATIENTGEAQFAGIITATGADFSGAVNVGGVLTYEDVTSVDSVGVITARAGLDVTGGSSTFAGEIKVEGSYTPSGLYSGISRYGSLLIGTSSEAVGNAKLAIDSANGNITSIGSATFGGDISSSTAGGVKAFSTGTVIANRIGNANPVSYADCFVGRYNGVDTSEIKADGSATFAGGVQSGGDPNNGSQVGASIYSTGGVYTARANATSAVFRGYHQGSSTANAEILANGSATFSKVNINGDSDSSQPGHIEMAGGGSAVVNGQEFCKISFKTQDVNVVGSDKECARIGVIAENDHGDNSDAKTGIAFFTRRDELDDPNERMRLDADGRLLVGTDSSIRSGLVEVAKASTDTQIQITESSDAGDGPCLRFTRTRGTNLDSPSPIEDGNFMGRIKFDSYDTAAYYTGAEIVAQADGQTWASGDCPTRLVFSTTPDSATSPTERLSIRSNGEIITGNLSINGYQYQNNNVTGYGQIAIDNHANTFFGQNLKLGASAGSGTHTLEVINQHASIGGAGMYIGGNSNTNRGNAISFYAVAANQSPGTDVTNQDRLRIGQDNTFFWTQPTNYYNSAQSYLRTFGFTFNMADGEEEVMFYNPDGYRRTYYQIYVQSGHGSNGYGYILCNSSRYGTVFHDVNWAVGYTTYGHASNVTGNVNYNGVKLTRTGTYGTVTYYVIVKAFSPSGGNPFSTSGLTDASYRYYNQGF